MLGDRDDETHHTLDERDSQRHAIRYNRRPG